jgi:hypothetical protein
MGRRITAILHVFPDEKVKYLFVGAYSPSLSADIEKIEGHIPSCADQSELFS